MEDLATGPIKKHVEDQSLIKNRKTGESPQIERTRIKDEDEANSRAVSKYPRENIDKKIFQAELMTNFSTRSNSECVDKKESQIGEKSYFTVKFIGISLIILFVLIVWEFI